MSMVHNRNMQFSQKSVKKNKQKKPTKKTQYVKKQPRGWAQVGTTWVQTEEAVVVVFLWIMNTYIKIFYQC